MERAAGILLHPTSLPGPHGIGSLGKHARRFLRDLRSMRQSVWQILPFSPTGFGDSPYQGLSTFAGNPLWIDLDVLVQNGLLRSEERKRLPRFPTGRVEFGRLIPARTALVHRVAEAFPRRASPSERDACAAFADEERDWLDDFSLFAALKESLGGRVWTEWPRDLARRKPSALREARRRLARAVKQHRRIQFLFQRQWLSLREYAGTQGVRIFGDVPLFVAHDSADVWARPDLFKLDSAGNPSRVAGVPPDYFSATGQRWGNPVYEWARHAEEGYTWWIRRLQRTLDLVDAVRLDHFRGFAQAWEIPADAPTAERGAWVDGPGSALFAAVKKALGALPLVAEDLGHITPDVHALRDRFGLPGMRVLPFTLDDLLADPEALLKHGPEREVFYSGTHDNDTLVGWLRSALRDRGRSLGDDDPRKKLLAWLPGEKKFVHRALVELVLNARSRWSIFPLQDVLGLGSEARMNRPGTAQGNWQWRLTSGLLTPDTMAWLARETEHAGRV